MKSAMSNAIWKDLWGHLLRYQSRSYTLYNFPHDGTDELSFISQMRFFFPRRDPASTTQVYTALHLRVGTSPCNLSSSLPSNYVVLLVCFSTGALKVFFLNMLNSFVRCCCISWSLSLCSSF
jgi:hypothetical protein